MIHDMTRVTRIRRRIENATYRMVPLMQLRLFQRSSKSVKPMRFRSSLLLQAKCTYVYFPTPITLHWSKIANFYARPVFNVPVQEDLVGISLRFIHMGKLKSWIYLVVKNVDTFKQLLQNTIIRQTYGLDIHTDRFGIAKTRSALVVLMLKASKTCLRQH